MLRSLVGSEMCIRDSFNIARWGIFRNLANNSGKTARTFGQECQHEILEVIWIWTESGLQIQTGFALAEVALFEYQGCSLGLERLGLEAVSRRFFGTSRLISVLKVERLGLVSVLKI